MKSKKIINILFLLVGILLLLLGLFMIQNVENRWLAGIDLLISLILMGIASKRISNDVILKDYLEAKKQMKIKPDLERENEITRKAASKSNLIVSLLLIIAVVIIIFTGVSYTVLAFIIIISILLQSSLNAFLYIYYDKRIKYKTEEKKLANDKEL